MTFRGFAHAIASASVISYYNNNHNHTLSVCRWLTWTHGVNTLSD